MRAGSTNTARRRESTAGMLLYLLFGPIVWAAHLTVVYGMHTLVCARGILDGRIFGVELAVVVLMAATTVALALVFLGMLALNARRLVARVSSGAASTSSFCDSVMRWLALLSAFGIAYAGAAALVVAPCAAVG